MVGLIVDIRNLFQVKFEWTKGTEGEAYGAKCL